jgi:hypothetical protein
MAKMYKYKLVTSSDVHDAPTYMLPPIRLSSLPTLWLSSCSASLIGALVRATRFSAFLRRPLILSTVAQFFARITLGGRIVRRFFVYHAIFLRPHTRLTVFSRRRRVRSLNRIRRGVHLISGRVGWRGAVHFFEVRFS